MSRNDRVSAVLLVLSIAAAREAKAATHPDYALVAEADQAVAEGDFAGARRRLSGIAEDSVARADAKLVQAKLERALGPQLASRQDVVIDDQPFMRWTSLLEIKSWIAPRFELGAGIEAGSVFEPAELGHDGGLLLARLRMGAALLDAAAWLGVRRWFDGAESVQGEAALTVQPTGKIRGRLGGGRSDELTTFRAVSGHVFRDGAFVEAELHSLARLSGALRGDVFRHSDRNRGLSASAWCTIELIDEPAKLAVGYAGAYADSAESRWQPLSQVYDPYFTPLLSIRHGPVASLGARYKAISANVSAHYALLASERDPSTLGYYYSRRAMLHFDLRAALAVEVEDAAFSLRHRYQLEAYYTAHVLELKLNVPL